MLQIYIFNVQPLLIDDEVMWDIFYLKSTSTKINCIRVFDIELSFLIARLPGLTEEQFKEYLALKLRGAKIEYRKDLRESEFFDFEKHRLYAEVFSKNPVQLKSYVNTLHSELKYYYKRLDVGNLPPEDYIFYKNSETPLRFTSTTTDLKSTIYNLSCKYNIPLIGGATLDETKLESPISDAYLPNINGKFSGLNFKNISALKRDDNINFQHNMRLLAYDIETYTPDGPKCDPMVIRYEIFCIGIGIFALGKEDPIENICLISKDFDKLPEEFVKNVIESDDDKAVGKTGDKESDTKTDIKTDIKTSIETKDKESDTKTDTSTDVSTNASTDTSTTNSKTQSSHAHDKTIVTWEETKLLSRKAYLIKNEYKSGKTNDSAYYIICKNERDLLECYCEVLETYRPQIITGFNTYGFDDKFVYKRCELYNMEQEYLQCFNYYHINELDGVSWYKSFMPSFKDGVILKIDGRLRKDNATVFSWNVLATDVYKIMLKEDAKRFTQQGYGNLNTMLNVYKVHNPYNGEQLSKTDMSIEEMFDNWKKGINIYEIALYCRQDAWITGTLIIKRAKFGDMIELANVSFTSLRDSIFKADGMRVNNSIIAEAYSQGFAYKDEKSNERLDIIEGKENIVELGGKQFDTRTIVGGAVKNLHPGINKFVVALDFSSMYPSQKEANMADSSSRVDDDIINDPEKYGLKIVKSLQINDMYGDREIKYIKVMTQ